MAPGRSKAAMRFTPKNLIPVLGDLPSKQSVHFAMTRFHDELARCAFRAAAFR